MRVSLQQVWRPGIASAILFCMSLSLLTGFAFVCFANPSHVMHPLSEGIQGQTNPAPELDGGTDWLNTSGPLKLKDLKGKVVLLDFWTYCCINCIHILPDLEKLEKKYPNELVVIGVHSAKFNAEKVTANIRDAVLRYNIEHPVVNDAQHKIWDKFRARSWPTFCLIDPEGNIIGYASGEGNFDVLDQAVGKLIEIHKAKKTLDGKPMKFVLEKEKQKTVNVSSSPLRFPGKILADATGKRLFIADSSNHRLVITTLEGKKLEVIGSGVSGAVDGNFDQSQFNDPQGMALDGNLLYVADRKNHLIRLVDLAKRTVSTIAGTGKQGQRNASDVEAKTVGLNSPWDLLLIEKQLYIAMAGHHQIWQMDVTRGTILNYAGDGRENIGDGSLSTSKFAQPSGLTTDGTWLYVADSEISAVRAVGLKENKVSTLVGTGLFDFGDKDGKGDNASLQHALGVAYYQGKLLVADTYNNKIKLLDPKTRMLTTLLGDGKAGTGDNPPRFQEPAGLSIIEDTLFVADTNNHLIRKVDLKSKAVTTLKLDGVLPPVPPKVKPTLRNVSKNKAEKVTLTSKGELEIEITLKLAAGLTIEPVNPVTYIVEAGDKFLDFGELPFQESQKYTLKVPIEKLSAASSVTVAIEYYPCRKGDGVCTIQSEEWEVPVNWNPASTQRTIRLSTTGK